MHRVLEGIVRNRRIASAYLFSGPPDAGKREEAETFADRLGSRSVDKLLIEPKGASLKIEQIRELQQIVRSGPAMSPVQCVIIEGADSMTDEAAGAFLKTLEEPPAGVVFVLLVEREDRLPGTIASRCQKILFEEKKTDWKPDPALAEFYRELRSLKQKGIIGQISFAARLEKERERIEDLLYDLTFYAMNELKNLRMVRILLDAVKNIKRKANVRLALDVACLKMGEV